MTLLEIALAHIDDEIAAHSNAIDRLARQRVELIAQAAVEDHLRLSRVLGRPHEWDVDEAVKTAPSI